jgi:hypothetical protein
VEVPEVPPSISKLLSSDVVIARVGALRITVREFFLTSLFGPAFVKNRPDTRRRILEYMINEKLLALGAKANANDPRVLANLAALEGDMATEELYRDDVLKYVRVTEREIDKAVDQQKTTIALRWLYRKERGEAAAVARRLRSGGSFDSLFQKELSDRSIPTDDRRMDATLFQIQRRNPPMAALAENLQVGVPSAPVEGPDGFYIVRIDSLNVQMLTTESAQAQARADARRALTKIKADSLSDAYVRRRMLDADPVIQRPTFDLLRAYLGSRILSPERFESFSITRNLERGSDYRQIDRYGSRTLVQLRSGKITLREFLAWYRLREANMTFRNSSAQAFFLSVEDVVWRMVRDQLLVNTALRRGLERRPGVIRQKRWWSEKLLYQVAKDSIMRTIGWTDSTLYAYYAENPRSFRDSSRTLHPFDQVKNDVLREWYDLELKGRVLHTLNRLKNRFAVTIDDEVLRGIPLDAENDPRAMELYTVKKGGTFPHPAFPTIDYYWQSWQ